MRRLVLTAALLLGVKGVPAEPPAITDPARIWAMPTEEKSLRHPLRIEGRVNYFDAGFKLLWIERDGTSVYIQVSADPPALRDGQYVVIEGTIIPNQGLAAADVKVAVVREKLPVEPIDTRGRINDLVTLGGQIVKAEGYVDSQQVIDAEHVRLILIVENRPVICWVRPDNPQQVPDWRGQFVRATGLYSSRFDPTKTRMSVELWVGAQAGVQLLGTLQNNTLFDQPETPISEIYRHPPGTRLKVRGRLETHEPGQSMTIRDETGQVEVHSIQSERMEPGVTVEVVGHVKQTDGWIIENALYRKIGAPGPGPDKTAAAAGPLVRVADIRSLGQAEARQARPVDITGMVTWSLPESDIFFMQDASGGIRVHYDRAKTGTIAYGKYFNIKGVTRTGQPIPGVELQQYVDLGSMSHPRARPITLEQAFTGQPDGEWVELRGFLRRTDSEGDWRWIHVATPSGEFVGHLQSPVNFVANPGALIRMHGVCDATVGPDGRISGVTLRVPFLHDITIEQDAPANSYDLPRRALEDLEQLGVGSDMLRVRVTGTVLHAVPGQQIYLAGGKTGLLVFTHEAGALQPGDRIEAVGILGREGVHTVLREVVYRRTGGGTTPTPQELKEINAPDPASDLRLVRVRGTLLDIFNGPKQTRLTLQQGETNFEAILDHRPGDQPPRFDLTAELELTGIYRVTYDDSRQARGFELLVRAPGDITLVTPAQLWTVRRGLTVIALLAGCLLLGLAWISALRQRVQRQTEQIRKQMEQQARLEVELQHAARLESLGGLAGGIAHDYNNLLTVIMGNLSLMKLEPRVMEIEGARVQEIERGVFRARDLTRQLLTFASGGEPFRTAVDLPGVTREAADSVVRGTNVQAEHTVESGLWPAGADRDQLMQAVQNLVRNAVQAMPGGGVVRLTLANESIRGGAAGGLAPGRYVRLMVADTGEGIPAETIPKIFDPYFSTKKGARGLGLATVYSIVSKHGGRITATSTLGRGATFTVWLPAATPVVKETAPPGPVAPPAASGRPRVLLMDDEESIRLLAGLVIERLGLEPTLVADGENALREFEAARNTGRPFSLIILDLTIPGGMGGKQTIEALRRVDQQVPAIVSSGYSSDPVMANYRSHGFQSVVAKPFDVTTLAEAIRRFIPQAKPI